LKTIIAKEVFKKEKKILYSVRWRSLAKEYNSM